MKKIELTSGGKKLAGTIISPSTPKDKNPAILFIHGWTSAKERSYQYAEALAKLGFISFLFDMRGHGESEGDINIMTSQDFSEDDIIAYDYLVGRDGVDKNNVSAIGSSLGGHLVALLTAKRKLNNIVLRAPADYPDAYYDKPKSQFGGDLPEIANWRKTTHSYNESKALRALHDFDGNILIIESEKDTQVPHETVQNYVDAVVNKNKLTHIVMKNAPHSIKEGPFRDEVTRILTEWFNDKN